MNKILLLLFVPFVFCTAVSAQITQKEADAIVLEQMRQDTASYTIYAKADMQTGMTITTAAGEILEFDYSCWSYYISYADFGRYLIVNASNGNLLAINPKSNAAPEDLAEWRIVTPVSIIVTTLVGQSSATEFNEGSFDEATFLGFENPATVGAGLVYLTVDDQYNIFACHQDNPSGIILVDQKNEMVKMLLQTGGTPLSANHRLSAPTVSTDGLVLVPADGGDYADVYWEFDPNTQWEPQTRNILHPTAEQQAEGITDFTINLYKHSLAYCPYDGMIYLRSNRDGYLIKFDPVTRVGQSVVINGVRQICNSANSDTYLVFDPIHPTRLYCSSSSQHCIHYFDILTGETGVYAGTVGQSGWRDGKKENALFYNPRQMVFDTKNNLVIADAGNNCIRRITPDGTVETMAGTPGKKGYQDGSAEDALFDNPWGLAIDKDGTIYVADTGNHCIRKIRYNNP